ncbi:MAG: ADP-glyceromanno-heptose 6-epimerase [Chlamydiia bacterium]|nr:ADP-glyceromanno-heptose 6-epimerase [Chlamydiia bacterium]
MKIFEDKYIVITGGAGFIGSCMIRHLNDLGFKNLIIVDELGSNEKWKNLVGKSFIEFVPKRELFSWLVGKEKDIEAFIHLGACSSTIERNADYLIENNTRFSIRLAEYALTCGHRFIYASSAATYGDGTLGFSDDHALLDRYRPLNMYGFSKQLFDLWVKENGLLDKVVGLKYFNIFGPNELHKGNMASALVKMVPDAQLRGVIHLFRSNDPGNYADGEQKRDFLYVKDAVKMTAAFLSNDQMGIFNIGRGISHSWNELAHAVFKALEKPPFIEYVEMPDELAGKYQNYTCALMKKSKEAKGCVLAETSLEDAVFDYVRHYLIPGKRW